MRLQRRLCGVYTVCFLIFLIPFNCKLVSFFFKSFKCSWFLAGISNSMKNPLKDCIQRLRLTLNLEWLYLRVSCRLYRSSLWVTLYMINFKRIKHKLFPLLETWQINKLNLSQDLCVKLGWFTTLDLNILSDIF